jgi:hypothetical protein
VAGLLAPYAEGFRAELLGQGYTQGSAAHQIHLMAHLSRWLEAQGLEPAALDERVASDFAAARRADGYAAQLSARPWCRCWGTCARWGWRRRGWRSRRRRVTG